MKTYILTSKQLYKHLLPNEIEEFYSIFYQPSNSTEKYQITFAGDKENNIWHLKSNGMVNIDSGNGIIDEIELNNYQSYQLKILGNNEIITLFAMPDQETELYALGYNSMSQITIGNDGTSNLCYQNAWISKLQATISLKENSWELNAGSELKTHVYVNDRAVNYTKLKYGDIIFIAGLKIIWMPEFIMVNNPNGQFKALNINAYGNTLKTKNEVSSVSDEEAAVDLYKEDDYFYHIPRIKEMIEEEELEIDAPPNCQINDDLPFWLSIGTSLTMVGSSCVMGFNVFNGIQQGRDTMQMLPQIIMVVAMLIGSLIMPRVLKAYQKKKAIQKEALRQTKYKEFLGQKETEINHIMCHQVDVLNQNNDNTIKCLETINNKTRSLWNREIIDEDFLEISLGYGNEATRLNISAPEEHFTLDKDNLFESVYQVVDNSKIIKNVPITFNFVENNITSFIFNCPLKDDYINSFMTKLLTFHSGADLKIVIFTSEKRAKYWDYCKLLPHCWNDEKNLRFFATNTAELNEVSAYLDAEFKKRAETTIDAQDIKKDEDNKDSKNDKYKAFYPYYLIITDNYNDVKNGQIILDVLKSNDNIGFSLITLADSMKFLPSRSERFIQISEKTGCILSKKISAKNQKEFVSEIVPNLDMEGISTKLASIPLMPKDGLKVLPNSLSFLEMFNASKIEQLNILNRWQTNNPVLSLATTIGVHTDSEPFKLDLHEKFHGPHGLIAGSTGSGKSEFIITYILSMAVNYHPYEVQFVLIDYKGGGLAGAFLNNETGVKLPHLVGTITNLDTSEMNRTLVSIDSELKRRQKVFNETKDSLGESTIDIYKYQRLYREGRVKEPMAHLFIISDEFAELKAQQPEFMNQLISTARIGRSLGLHLILATQKPSGVVNDQIWSNSKFKVCLKVQDRGDSNEMLKRPDAASLKEAGRFYLQVGYDDYFDIGQSGWGGAKYIPTNKIFKKVDDSISFVNNTGYIVKSINEEVKKDTTEDMGDQLTNIVRYLYDLGNKNKFITKQLWLAKIPEEIFIDKLRKKYNYSPKPYYLNPVIGEYDSPSTQEQGILNLDLSRNGNTIIFGQSGSGKENLLSTILWSLTVEHTPDEVNIYIIDCGAETLKMFYKTPHVGDIVTINEAEKIGGVFDFAFEELDNRKKLFADFAGSYSNYCQNSGHKLPQVVIVINNYDNFSESFAKMADEVQSIYRECSKYGIYFIISAVSSSAVRNKMLQCFENKISLQLPNDSDYRNLFNCSRNLIPSKYFGRGIALKNEEFYEFQTAYFSQVAQMNDYVKMAAKKMNEVYKTKAKKIMIIPDVVDINMIINKGSTINGLPVGYDVNTKDVASFNFNNHKISLVLANSMMDHMLFAKAIIRQLSLGSNKKVTVVDFANVFDAEIRNVSVLKEDITKVLMTISNELRNDQNSVTTNYYFFIAPGLISNNNGPAKQIFDNMLLNANKLIHSYFILVDDYDDIKNIKYDEWYQNNIDTSSGIWLGEGIGSQMAFNITNLSMDDRKLSFPCIGFIINNGKKNVIKYVNDSEIINMEENHD